MTLILYAQPYDISAEGFYFRDSEEYERNATVLTNAHGDPVEEFEIQFIDGEQIDCVLAKAWEINQANFAAFLEAVEDWYEDAKIRTIIAVGECGCDFDPDTVDPDEFDVDVYELDSLKELAWQFIEEGLFGDIPEQLMGYINLDAVGRDLGMDYGETTIAGRNFVYRCA